MMSSSKTQAILGQDRNLQPCNKKIPFLEDIDLRALSVVKEPWITLHNTTHFYSLAYQLIKKILKDTRLDESLKLRV